MKIGRNQPCPCGSGTKYKQCCRAAHEAARVTARAESRPKADPFQAYGTVSGTPDELERLDALSNGALDLIRSGHLDDAERMCRELLEVFPDLIDGHMRLGHLYRVRGDSKKAAEHLRCAAAMARTPDYDPEVATGLDAEADSLDPPSA